MKKLVKAILILITVIGISLSFTSQTTNADFCDSKDHGPIPKACQ